MIGELYSILTSPAFWWTLVGIVAVPYGMYLVAYVFESRRPGNRPGDVPVWRGQSKAYVPGEVGLALAVTVCLQYRSDVAISPLASVLALTGSALAGVGVFVFARKFLYTPNDYSKGAWNSPSKRYHDFVMFGGFTVFALYVCLPVYFTADWTTTVLVHLLGFFGIALWVVGNIYDFLNPETIDKKRQHPDTYQPRWRWLSRLIASR